MFTNTSYHTTVTALQQALGAASLRQEVLANNISNVNTPNYKRQDVSFEFALRRALHGPPPMAAKRSMPRHMEFTGVYTLDTVQPTLDTVTDTTMRNDGNNVDIDVEMAALAKNSLMYNALATRVGDKFKLLGLVLTETGR